jgi:DNA-binding CsgD family transcriptional regulator
MARPRRTPSCRRRRRADHGSWLRGVRHRPTMRPMPVVPLIVVEGSGRALEHAVAAVRNQGWDVIPGLQLPVARGRRLALLAEVAGAADAEAALLAALEGSGLILHARADREVIDRLVDDLRRLGPVDHRLREPEAGPDLPAGAVRILELLAAGHSLGEAANRLGLARRTADRRLAAARQALGVERTTEAIARARRLGLLGSQEPPPA